MCHIFISSAESNLKYIFITLHCVGVNEDEEGHNLEPGFCRFVFSLNEKYLMLKERKILVRNY